MDRVHFCQTKRWTEKGEPGAKPGTGALRALPEWFRLWWWDQESIITVLASEQIWRVRAQRVLDWEFRRRNLERRREKV